MRPAELLNTIVPSYMMGILPCILSIALIILNFQITLFGVCMNHYFEILNFVQKRISKWMHSSKIKVRSHQSNATSNDFWLMPNYFNPGLDESMANSLLNYLALLLLFVKWDKVFSFKEYFYEYFSGLATPVGEGGRVGHGLPTFLRGKTKKGKKEKKKEFQSGNYYKAFTKVKMLL